MRRQLSLKFRIALTIFVLEAIMMAAVLWHSLAYQTQSTMEQMAESEHVLMDLLLGLSRSALLTDEYAQLQPYIEEARRDPRVVTVVLTDAEDRVVASSSPVMVGVKRDAVPGSTEETHWRVRTIQNEAGYYGKLAVEFSQAPLMKAMASARARGLGIALVGMALIAVVGVLMGYLLTRRLDRLELATTRLAQGNYSVRSDETGDDEIGRLAQSFDKMAARIEENVEVLQRSENRFALAARATNDGIWDWQISTGEIYFSPRCGEMLGFAEGENWGTFTSWRDRIHPEDLGRVLEIWAGYMEGQIDSYTVDYRMRTRLGHYIWVRSKGIATRDEDDNVVRITGALTDITEQRLQAATLAHQALHDSLTGLPNRTLFYDRLRQAILVSQRENSGLAVLMMDLDRFKEINDALGHQIGDVLLKRVGMRLHQVLRESDTVARLGGDEFGVLIPEADMSVAVSVARKIVRTLEEPLQLDRHQLNVGASIGIALFPVHGESADLLIQRADVAMYVAKQSSSGYSVYDFKQDRHSISRLNLISELRYAINFEQLVLYYHPEIDLKTGAVHGAEALVRWRHPQQGLLLPEHFIPLAEQTGLIKPLTRWVLNAAMAQMSAWRNDRLDLRISINLSARNLHEHSLVADIKAMMKIWGVPAEKLTLEITESALMTHSERAGDVLSALGHTGVHLSIDDFGTGYSSLANLKALPVNALKVDKSFVMDMERDDNDAVIVRSIIDLAHNLGLRVTAEGVETRDIWDLLRILKCDAAQGMFVCEPLPADAFAEWAKHYRPTVEPVARKQRAVS